MATWEQLKAAACRATRLVDVCGVNVTIRKLSPSQHFKLAQLQGNDGRMDSAEFRKQLLAMSLVDDSGAPLVPDGEAECLINDCATDAIGDLVAAVLDFNGYGVPLADRIDEAKKN